MKALVVFDSFFGNTEKIAASITKTFAAKGEGKMVRASELKGDEWQGVDVLLVGSPTRAFSASPATKTFLNGLTSNSLQGKRVAAFDTRLPVEKAPGILKFLAKLFGFAALQIEKALAKKGGTLAAPAEGFFVEDSEGPLKEGELERAAAWATKLFAK
jgi:flavodoxin I